MIPDKRLLDFLAFPACSCPLYVPIYNALSLSLAMLPETCEQIMTDMQAAFSVFIVDCAMTIGIAIFEKWKKGI